MNKIEEIREEAETSDSYREWFEIEWNNRGKGAVDELIERNKKLSNNVQLLLAKLELAEKALDSIANCGEDRPDAYPLMNIADDALTAIRS